MSTRILDKPDPGLAIQIKRLRKSYGKVQALKGIDLEVRVGEIFGFLGPNGAGKTTTIRCLLDMIRPNGGQAYVLGVDPQKDPLAVQKRTGYLPGEMAFYENLTVEGQLRFFNDMRGRRSDWKEALKLAEQLDLELKKQIKNLSKGNKQKVGIVQALMHRPKLLILDEPTSGLDPLIQQQVMALLREAHADGATIFFSSHIMSEVENIAERVGIIRGGEIAEVADTRALMSRSLNRIKLRFKTEVNPEVLTALPGVEILQKIGPTAVTLQVTGDMEGLVRTLACLPVLDLETERPSLEEVFLSYYKK